MRIKSIHLINFQNHKESFFDLSEGVNVVVGQSDSGKTSIIRALNWVVNNKPSGDSYRRHNSKSTSVIITLESGVEIARVKSDKENYYRVGDVIYKAFGQDVPEEVKKLFNFSDINFQQQMDAPFLLSNSSGEVARTLNEAVNLDKIDLALSAIGKIVRDTNTDIKTESVRKNELEERMLTYANLDAMRNDIEHLDSLQLTLTQIRDDANSLSVESNAVLRIKEKLLNYENLPVIEKLHSRMEEIYREQQKVSEEAFRLRLLINNYKGNIEKLDNIKLILHYEQDINDLSGISDRLQEVRISKFNLDRDINQLKSLSKMSANQLKVIQHESEVDKLYGLDEKCESLDSEIVNLERLHLSLSTTRNLLSDNALLIQKLEEEFAEEMPDICPLCEQVVVK